MSDHKANPLAFGNRVRNPPRIRDTFGRVLSPGDEVIFTKVDLPQFVLADAVPEFAPGVPPGMMRVILTAQIIFHAPADSIISGLIRIQTAAEKGVRVPAQTPNGDGGGDNPPPGDTPPDPTH